MKRIAILRCLQSNDVCTGAACLSAFFQQKDSFTAYQGEEINLTAFFSCNGCGKIALKNDEGMQEKLDHLVQMHTDVVHIGICCFHKDKGGGGPACARSFAPLLGSWKLVVYPLCWEHTPNAVDICPF